MKPGSEVTYGPTDGLYFGTLGQPGHYWHSASGEIRGARGKAPWSPWKGEYVDGKLNPSMVEGEAAIHHRDGWTAIAWADYSGDVRPGSNAVFIVHGTRDFDSALALARAEFPGLFARYSYTPHLRLAVSS